jgi:UDP-D-galactose:(glucosyl)LPS alpha-1,3-D-galactosyltransferase
LDLDAAYFNSGVLLVNAPRWRQLRMSEACFEYLSLCSGRLRFPDQDALNVAAYGRWLRLGREWNHMKSWRLEPDSEFLDREPAGRIVHFAGPWKPWKPESDGGLRAGARRARYDALARQARLRDRVTAAGADAGQPAPSTSRERSVRPGVRSFEVNV